MVKGETGFTRYNLVSLLIATFLPSLQHHLLPVLFCTSLWILVSFHGSQLLDHTSWSRMAALEETNMITFMVFNVLAHIIPAIGCYTALVILGIEVLLLHGIIAATFHLGWGVAVSQGKPFLSLDHIYAPMEHADWRTLWVCAAATELIIAPLFF